MYVLFVPLDTYDEIWVARISSREPINLSSENLRQPKVHWKVSKNLTWTLTYQMFEIEIEIIWEETQNNNLNKYAWQQQTEEIVSMCKI